jgi:hypothetical protein
LDKFKTKFKAWIEMHIEIMNRRIMTPADVQEKEKKYLNIDMETVSIKMSE